MVTCFISGHQIKPTMSIPVSELNHFMEFRGIDAINYLKAKYQNITEFCRQLGTNEIRGNI